MIMLIEFAIGLFAIAHASSILLRLNANARNGDFLVKQTTVGRRDV